MPIWLEVASLKVVDLEFRCESPKMLIIEATLCQSVQTEIRAMTLTIPAIPADFLVNLMCLGNLIDLFFCAKLLGFCILLLLQR